MQADTDLTPCPFCGGAARHLEERTGFWTERTICDTCNFHLTRTHTESAVTRWNRRAPTAPPAQEARVPLNVDALAQEIRRVDGNHSLGAGALAEALLPWITAAQKETP